MISFPNAKINIGLNITRKREDGYHDLETVFYPVNIRDAIEVVEADITRISFSGNAVPGDPDSNLCLLAYKLLALDFELPPVHIHLYKHIPIGAGLGGGSADAAFFIKLLNGKFKLGMNAAQMEVYAKQLGADCSFFLYNTPKYAFGKGDEFEEISLDLSAYHLILVMPPLHVSTAEAYRGVQPHPSSSSLKELIREPVAEWRYQVLNQFEEGVFKLYPEIGELKAAMYQAGALYASMSGSGASVYGIFEKKVLLPEIESVNAVFYGV